MRDWHAYLLILIVFSSLGLFVYFGGTYINEANRKARQDPNYYVGRYIDVDGKDCVIEHQRVGTVPIRRTRLVAICK